MPWFGNMDSYLEYLLFRGIVDAFLRPNNFQISHPLRKSEFGHYFRAAMHGLDIDSEYSSCDRRWSFFHVICRFFSLRLRMSAWASFDDPHLS